MSVLIKGLKMPKEGCKDCLFVKRGNVFDICPLLRVPVDDDVEFGGSPSNCPLIELPDHGDLIDRDALIKRLRDYACKPCKEYGADKNGDRCEWCSFDDAFARIEKAKKVIPAERSEE